VGVGARKTGDPFTVLVASGQKPGGDAEGSAGATRRVARAQKTKRERP
jgi:hypothetical protein